MFLKEHFFGDSETKQIFAEAQPNAFCARQENDLHLWFASSKIGFCVGTKVFEEALNAVKFLGWLKTFGPAQNILEPVKGQGIKIPYSTVHRLGGQLSEVEAIHVHGHILYVIYCKLCIKRSRISWIHHIFCYVVLLLLWLRLNYYTSKMRRHR